MTTEIDPRLKAIMDKLNKSTDEAEEDKSIDRPESPPAPRTLEEFIDVEKLDEWPYRITCETVLDLSEEKQCIGSVDDIKEELHKATMIDMAVLNNLENKLRMFEYQVTVAADRLIVDPSNLDDDVLQLPMSVSRTFLTETKEGDIMKVHPSRKSKKSDASEETHKKSVDHCSFSGFRQGELTELPGQLEAPQILNRITKAQDFNPGLKRFWKKIFQSEASIAMMQDAFWWIFIDMFDKKHKKDQSKLFDRLADSFVALFTSINPEIKDKIFLMYSDCLCQAVYVAFVEAFPESLKQFDDEFKLKIVNTISEWITGISPNYGSWNLWDMKRLQLPVSKPLPDIVTQASGSDERALIEPKGKHTLPMQEFHRTIQQLGSQPRMATVVSMATNNTAQLSRDTPRMALNTSDGTSLTLPGTNLVPVNTSRQTQCVSPKKPAAESSYMGRGIEVERVLFNLEGRSPLITHFLRMHQLQDAKTAGRKVRRTQILKPPPGTKTYQDLIQETTETQKKLSKEYNRICDMTHKEINKIERQQRETARKIDELQQSIAHCHNSMEIKFLRERLFDSKDWEADGPLSSRGATEAKALMDVDKED